MSKSQHTICISLTKTSLDSIQNKKVIDFTNKIVSPNELFIPLNNNSTKEDDVFWWGLCLIKFAQPINVGFKNDFISSLRDNHSIRCIILDNLNDKDFLVYFNYIDEKINLFLDPIVLRKGVLPCVKSVAEVIPEIDWYHFSNITHEHRSDIAILYKTIYQEFYYTIESIEIVRDLFKSDFILL